MGSRRIASLAVLLAASPAAANPFQVFGLTSRHAAQANAGVASVDDAAALYYNPAGLVANPTLELAIGTVGAYSHLAIGDHLASLSDAIGAQLAMRAPLPLAGWLEKRIVVGIALHLLPHDVAHVIAPAPDQPFYPYYGDRLSRIVVLPGFAVQLDHGVALGASVDVLAGLTGSLAASEGATRAIDARVDERVPTIARVLAGIAWQLDPAVRLGAVYRQRFEVPFQTAAQTTVAGEPIDLDLTASGQFTPHEVVVGVAWSPAPLTASLDLGWAKWSDYPGPFVHVDSQLPLVGPVPGQTPAVPFKDTFAIRIGVESRRSDLIIRGGYAYETSPVPAVQTGETNLLDGPRQTFGFGLGYAWPHAANGHGIRLDAHVQLQYVGKRTLHKQLYDGTGTYDPYTSLADEDPATPGVQTTNPGNPSLRSGGELLSGGLTLEVGL